MTGWRNLPNFVPQDFDDDVWAEHKRSQKPPANWYLPEPLSIVTVPQPRIRAGIRTPPPGCAGRPSSRGRLVTAATVPDTHADWRWLIPAGVFLALCLIVKWWSDRQ